MTFNKTVRVLFLLILLLGIIMSCTIFGDTGELHKYNLVDGLSGQTFGLIAYSCKTSYVDSKTGLLTVDCVVPTGKENEHQTYTYVDMKSFQDMGVVPLNEMPQSP